MTQTWRGEIAALDFTRPWLSPFAERAAPVVEALARGATVADALCAPAFASTPATSHPVAVGMPLRFTAAQACPADEPYESHIRRTGTVPTRCNLHDLFNGLVWWQFPQAKRRLNALQAAEIARSGIGATRGALRDAITLFDENGAVLEAPPALWDALLARDWHRLFVAERALWQQARLHLFGHALLEKLVQPRKPATAHVLVVEMPVGAGTAAATATDAALAAALDPDWLATKPFVPLPVLGVPGWCNENENFSFYDDRQVFRPPPRENKHNILPVWRRQSLNRPLGPPTGPQFPHGEST
ncbi:DUF3025 domain-containing protein [Variovorax ginsengisoli]|uniref:DUF3025 domain-containing protein n=1 Tax=Variovorax ginsengisoli TaxID=363844 RepID=A0ABT9SBB8_9BURK|nr:DUF3025 domain-containing protein [Variovorax ginsengisoli]MDP9901647.1 hypothetical protein [Variovorax ginsengisoli]